MTQDLTRQLGIEFERRIQIIDPMSQFSNKLDTDTIYSILNEFQIEYIKAAYLSEDQVQSGTMAVGTIAEMTKSLLSRRNITVNSRDVNSDKWCDVCTLPDDFFLYVRSNSLVDKTYKTELELEHAVPVPNVLAKQTDVPKSIGASYNLGGIVRNPIAVLDRNVLNIIHDEYTHINSVDLIYYRKPHRFNVLGYTNNKVTGIYDTCELPYSCFEDLVQGAIQMFISRYKLGGRPPKKDEERKLKEDNNEKD